MEQEHHHWVVHDEEKEEEEEEEEVEGAALERRQFLPHGKDNVITGVVLSSSSSYTGNGGGHSNGVCSVATYSDKSPAQKEEEVAEMDTVGENGNHFSNDKVDYAAVGLGLVAEFVGAATNGEAITGTTTSSAAASQNNNSVYFDKQKGMWKCHHCTWNKRFDSPWMNVKTMIQHGPCFVCETKGNRVNGLNGVQNGDGARSVLPTNQGEGEFDIHVKDSDIQNSLCDEVNNQCMKTGDDKVPSSSELSPLHNSSDVQAKTVVNFDNKTSTKAGPNLIKEINLQLKELDVEAILAKQETHDLFCPNCNSCITERVILKKRKRNIHNLDNKAKRDKLDTIVSTKLVDSSAHEANQGVRANEASDVVSLEPPADNYVPEREPEVFRCLSCFSFFIPTGSGFNLFRNVGRAREHETSQNHSRIPTSNLQNPSNLPSFNANWLFSLFTSNKGKTSTEQGISNEGKIASEQGDASLEHSRTGPTEQLHTSSTTSNMLTSPEVGHPEGPLADTAIVKNVKPTPDIKHGHGGPNSLISSTVKSVKIESWIENDIKSSIAWGSEPLTDQKCLNPLFQNDLSSIQSCTKSAGDVMNGLQRVGQDFIDFSAKEQLLTGNVTNVEEKKNDSADIIKTNTVADVSSMSFSDDMVSKHASVRLETSATTETLVNAEEPAKDGILNPYEGEPEFLVSSTVGSPILEKSQKDVGKTPEIVQNSYSSFLQGAQSSVQSFGSTVLASDVASNKQSSGIDATIPSEQNFTLIEKVQKDIEVEINPSARKENKGGDVIVFVEGEAFKSTTSQTADNVPVKGAIMTETHTQVYIGEQPRAEIGEPQEWEILKSIVYGGLIESITSLGIVSSAAGSGASPLNIIALGLANLVGGLFILGHNLNELKNYHSGGDPQQTNMQEDRYQELLGYRANFLLHAVVAVLSFLIFGSVPLVIYGLLIRKNYHAEVKLAAVAATSVVCIILLAIGKVYTRRPPKSYIKTVLYYVTLALAASGVSYIGGNLIKDLLENLSHSVSGYTITMPFSDTRSMEPAWMSY